MAVFSLGELLQDFINESTSFEGQISSLSEIAETITRYKPSKIEKIDIERLIDVLFQIRLLLLEKKHNDEQIDTLDEFIAELTTLSYKEPKQRTKSNNRYLLSLGAKLSNFAALLQSSNIIAPAIIALGELMKYLSMNNYTQS